MQAWIALIRGINVGGRNAMPMARLVSTLESAGCRSVRTYIQSGNVVFDSASKSKRKVCQLVGDAIEDEFGFRPSVLLLSDTELRAAIKNNPFPEAGSEPKTLHFYFLESEPESPNLDALARLATPTERYQLINAVFYLHAPDGVGRSKLAAGAETKLGVAATARNYNTVLALSEILHSD